MSRRLIPFAMPVFTATVLAFAVVVFLGSEAPAHSRGAALSLDGGWLSQ